MTWVLNCTYEVIDEVPWQRAVTMIVLDVASVFEAHPDKVIRSKNLTIPMPRSIYRLKYAHVRGGDRDPVDARVSTTTILKRDRGRCGYCHGKATTMDHILPVSLGGATTWLNCIAACQACNSYKSDHLPEEMGMRLLWEPYVPDGSASEQRRVYKLLQAA